MYVLKDNRDTIVVNNYIIVEEKVFFDYIVETIELNKFAPKNFKTDIEKYYQQLNELTHKPEISSEFNFKFGRAEVTTITKINNIEAFRTLYGKDKHEQK